jgi:hypothetical protein
MIDLLLEQAGGAAQDGELLRALAAHEEAVKRSAGRSDLRTVGEAEAAVRSDPTKAFTFDSSGAAILDVRGRQWSAGRFEVASLGSLRERVLRGVAAKGNHQGRVHLWVVDGGAASTDIGSLQAHATDGTLFQVASQFNCLEATGPWVAPIQRYLEDPTQGPRASISALPGTLLRHYAAPGSNGDRFIQTSDGRQVELLANVCERGVASVQNGYLLSDEVADPRSLLQALESRFDAIRVGAHDAIEVVFGYDWNGVVGRSPAPLIAQVFTSTLAGGGYGTISRELLGVCRQLLRAAYLGTLLAALDLGHRRIVLTLIGGGVFGNPVETIWESILWALDEVAPLATQDVSVVVNARNLKGQLDLSRVRKATRDRGGFVLAWPASGTAQIHR